jgi:hypothetical protein
LTVELVDRPTTLDLLDLCSQLASLAQGVALGAGRFARLRMGIDGVMLRTVDASGAEAILATEGFPVGPGATPAGPLAISGADPDGLFPVALPPNGLAFQGPAGLALDLDLARSFSVADSGAFVFSPVVRALDAASFSEVDVRFDARSAVIEGGALDELGYVQANLVDARGAPVCVAPLVPETGGSFVATFVVDADEGPFYAGLVSPEGYVLDSDVSFEVDVRAHSRVEASFELGSFGELMEGGRRHLRVRGRGERARLEHQELERGRFAGFGKQREGGVGLPGERGGHEGGTAGGERGSHEGGIPGGQVGGHEGGAAGGANGGHEGGSAGGPRGGHEGGTPGNVGGGLPVGHEGGSAGGPRGGHEGGTPGNVGGLPGGHGGGAPGGQAGSPGAPGNAGNSGGSPGQEHGNVGSVGGTPGQGGMPGSGMPGGPRGGNPGANGGPAVGGGSIGVAPYTGHSPGGNPVTPPGDGAAGAPPSRGVPAGGPGGSGEGEGKSCPPGKGC